MRGHQALHDAIEHVRQCPGTGGTFCLIFKISTHRYILSKVPYRTLKKRNGPCFVVLTTCLNLLTVPTQPLFESLRTRQEVLLTRIRCHELTARQHNLGKTAYRFFKRVEEFRNTLRYVLERCIAFGDVPGLAFTPVRKSFRHHQRL